MKAQVMKAISILAVVSAVSAVAASSAAAALPEFSPEASRTKPDQLKGTGGASTINLRWNNATLHSYAYERTALSGRFVGPNEGTFEFEMIPSSSSSSCTNHENGNHEKRLFVEGKLKLGYFDKETKEVGLALETVKQPFVTCKGVNEIEEFIGSMVATISPVNKLTKSFTVTFSEQLPTHFEGESIIRQLENKTFHFLAKTFETTAPVVGTWTLDHFERSGSASEFEIKA
jgi:hypothetical protein